jgi:hypothetical protein
LKVSKGKQPWLEEEKLLNERFPPITEEILLGNILIGHDVFMPYGHLTFQVKRCNYILMGL